jgi:hypothetical protein
MTKPIPAWSTNLTVNIPQDERNLLGRLAVARGARSVSAFVKRLLLLGLQQECQASAEQLREIRRRYYGRESAAAVLLVLFCCTLFCHDSLRGFRRARGRDDVAAIQLLEGA